MNASENTPAAFMSYSRFDDKHERGHLTRLRKRLSNEVRAQTGKVFPIFQDRFDIRWGDAWQSRIDQALDAVTFLIPIISPSFFASDACREEVERFHRNEQLRGREDLIHPIYLITADEWETEACRNADYVARLLAAHQYTDWRHLRGQSMKSSKVRARIQDIAGILKKRMSPEGVMTAEASSQPIIAHSGTWAELAYALSVATFDSSSWHDLAMSANQLLEQLPLERPPHPTADGEVNKLLRQLETTLTNVLTGEASAARLAQVCARAEQLQRWLLELLPDPWR